MKKPLRRIKWLYTYRQDHNAEQMKKTSCWTLSINYPIWVTGRALKPLTVIVDSRPVRNSSQSIYF